MRVVSQVGATSAVVYAATWLCATGASAHEAPAEPPLFTRGACIDRIDKREQDTFEIPYRVAADDTALTMGDIAVEDAKTHQFFAFDASLIARGFGYDVFSLQGDAPGVELPLWITVDDVKRAAAASNSIDATGFSASDVPEGTVLDDVAALTGHYRRITADDARVPITMSQAERGVAWALADVEPELYTIAGYVFSPPYNGWQARDTKVKVIDGTLDVPALHVEPLRSTLFAYQGLHVRGCLDVPDGTQLAIDFQIEERPELGFVPWLPEHDARSGELQECFHHPRPELTGSLRLRFTLQAPDGTRRVYFAPEPITALPGAGECVASGNFCCDFEPPPGVRPGGCDAAVDAAGCAPAEPAGHPEAGMVTEEDSGMSESDEARARSEGCSIGRGVSRASGNPGLPWGLALVLALARRRIRA